MLIVPQSILKYACVRFYLIVVFSSGYISVNNLCDLSDLFNLFSVVICSCCAALNLRSTLEVGDVEAFILLKAHKMCQTK